MNSKDKERISLSEALTKELSEVKQDWISNSEYNFKL